ncbi:MAG TPA: carbohydrate kinase family protein [Acidobacteriota bacterium]|nr:carbohydrate kinase family protein [Acidobacteriota bacterium]
MAFDIVTCGSATVDVFAHTQVNPIGKKLIGYPSGGKILINSLQQELGGGGTNTAVAFSRLGLKTGYIGCVGNDIQGKQIQNSLANEKVSFLGQTSSEQTGYSVILDAIAHDRTILTYKGANDRLNKVRLPKTRWFYFSSMIGQSLKTQGALADYARKHGIFIAFNPSMYQVTKGIGAIRKILSATHILIFNKEEAKALTKKKKVPQMHKRLHDLGIPISVITDGSSQVSCYDGDGYYIAQPQKVKVVESTGAGDAFAAAFVWSYQMTSDIAVSLAAGIVNSQSVLGYIGAKKGLCTKQQLVKLLKSSGVAVKKASF